MSAASPALVTGASAGLGLDMARILAERGHHLVLTARSEERLRALARELEEAHGIRAHVVPADLAVPGAGPALAREVLERELEVEVLVNNAGFGQWGAYPELDADEEAAMLRLNVEALTQLTRALLPGMLERGRGRILNVASTAAFLPGPGMTAYYATKAYVLSYSQGLDEELRGTGVWVSCLCPGPTRTEFQERAGMRIPASLQASVLDSRTVARAGVDGLFRGRRIIVPGLLNRLTALAPRFLPRSWVTRIVGRIQSARSDTSRPDP